MSNVKVTDLLYRDDQDGTDADYRAHDPVNYPAHYTWLPNGLEVIDVTENFNFCLGNALKYIMRAGRKAGQSRTQDLEKARWYITREIARIEKGEA